MFSISKRLENIIGSSDFLRKKYFGVTEEEAEADRIEEYKS